MAKNSRTTRIGVVLVLSLVITGLGVAGGTGAAARWPSSPIDLTPLPTATPASSAIDEETLQRLTIFALAPGDAEVESIPVGSLSDRLQAVPGGSLTLMLGVYECCYFFQPVSVTASWSIAPPEGVRIDPVTGLLTVDPTTPNGSVYIVSADVENGRRVISTHLHVYTPEASPLVGYWVEAAQIDCTTGAEVVPDARIQELVFAADGTFTVTWFPFEVYHDYWGTYAVNLTTGALDLAIVEGNYVPADFDGTGHFSLDGGRLILTDIWLGAPPDENTSTINCGHVFA